MIIVDDGSTDGTPETIKAHPAYQSLESAGKAQIIALESNAGKGGALKAGVAAATCEYVLTLDADMSAKPMELLNWLKQDRKLLDGNHILIGSREHERSKITASKGRRFVGNVFNLLVRTFTPLYQSDTQCGFKLYPTEIAKPLFGALRVNGWAHDVELLYRANLAGVEVVEMPLAWQEEPGSKVKVLRDSFRMLWQIISIAIFLRWQYYFSEPVKSLFGRQTQIAPSGNGHPVFRTLFAASLISLLFFMPYISRDFGITADEEVQYYYGEYLLSYFTTLGADKQAQFCCPDSPIAHKPANLHYYGGFFDFVSAGVHHTFNFSDPFATRHAMNALFGFLAILFAALLARRFGGHPAAFLTIVLLVLTPRFFGHAMNNPKDIPFAAAYIFTAYFLFKAIARFPRPSRLDLFWLTIGIALSISIRVGGILLIAYTGFFGLVEVLGNKALRNRIQKDLVKYLKIGVPVVVLGYFLGLLFWPYAHLNPIGNPMEALGKMAQFDTNIRLLFEGSYIMSNEVPWYYILKYVLITAPLILLAGAILVPVVLFLKQYPQRQYLLLLFILGFPVAYAIYQQSPLYDGMRHFLFILPPLAIISALSWVAIARMFKSKWAPLVVGVAVVLLCLLPIRWMAANHPHQTVYYNEVMGGVDKAFGNYETDYWYNSMWPLTQKLVANEGLSRQSDTVRVVTNASFEVRKYFDRLGIPVAVQYAKYQAEDNWIGYDAQRNREEKRFVDWDYAMFISRFTELDELRNYWPPRGSFLTETAENTVMSFVQKRRSKADIAGYSAFRQGNHATAVERFTAYLSADTSSAYIWYLLGAARYNLSDFTGAADAFEMSTHLRPDPQNLQLYSLLGNAYMNTGQATRAIQFGTAQVNRYEVLFQALQRELISQTQVEQGDLNRYLGHAQVLTGLHTLLANAYQAEGNTQQAQQHANASSQYRQILNQYQR